MVLRSVSADLDTASLRKSRGAFFTPEPLARYITDWAVRSVEDRILEPSCGEAAFLLAAVDRLAALEATSVGQTVLPHLDGVELHADSARAARALLTAAGVEATVTVGDFFTVKPGPQYDVVIGNPPYVRYQEFTGESRARSRAAALRAGVALTGLASSWAAFTVHAAQFLKPGGRLGLVLPAELMTVNYAAGVRRFLLQHFQEVDLVAFDERVFPGVLEEVVLLLADGYAKGPTDHFRLYQARNADDLAKSATPRLWRPIPPGGKWIASLLRSETLAAYFGLLDGPAYSPLETWGDTTLGMVTGNNRFFALSPDHVRQLGLGKSDLIRLSPPGSRHLRGLALTTSALADLGDGGAATWLFRPSGEPSAAGWAYIASGEAKGVDLAYKCRVRKPWWRVPRVPPADLFLTYMNADTPRLSTNRARAHHLNSVHGVYLQSDHRALGADLLPLAALNSATLLGAEMVGRAYGGGMLKLEPKEADLLPVPSPTLTSAAADALRKLRPQLTSLLRQGRVVPAAHLVDEVLLIGELGISLRDVMALRQGHEELATRRVARGGAPRGDASDRIPAEPASEMQGRS